MECNIELIERVAKNLAKRISGTNQWISENPNTSPNMYEYVSYLIDFGQLANMLNNYFEQTEWPIDPESNMPFSSNDIWRTTPGIYASYTELLKLGESRRIYTEGFCKQDEEAYYFLLDLKHCCITGHYKSPPGIMFDVTKEVLCKSISIPFYIWQTKLENPEYQYDNFDEYNDLCENYKMLKLHDTNSLADNVGNMIRKIDENYKYAKQSTEQLPIKRK